MEFNLNDYNKPDTPERTAELILDILDNDELIDNSGDETIAIKLFYDLEPSAYHFLKNDDTKEFGDKFENVPNLFVTILYYYFLDYSDDMEDEDDNSQISQLYIYKNIGPYYTIRVEHTINDTINYFMFMELRREEMFEFVKFMDEYSVPIFDVLQHSFLEPEN